MKAIINTFVEGVLHMTHEEFRNKIKASPRQAHMELFKTYFNYVYTIVFNRLRSCSSHEDIEDCVCDVFADVYIYYDTQKELSGDISGFIGTVARRKSADLYRKNMSRSDTVPIDDKTAEQIADECDIEKENDNNELRRIILKAISELGEPDSTIIIQKYYYGRSAVEIAKIVSLSPENVRVRSSRAVFKLKKILKKNDIFL